jgi:hypothetical protein
MQVGWVDPKRVSSMLLLAAVLALGGGCTTVVPPVIGAYDYFVQPAPDDAWSYKIRGWQQRDDPSADVAELPAPPEASAGQEHPGLERDKVGDLRSKYDTFRTERRRALARDVASWIQSESRVHYVPDGAIDHWATFEETFESNGDDCDGLELLTFHFLRELGFPEDEVFRAIVVRRADGQHHMVTLWFEDRDDPWVIDPTGAMTTGMPRMSEVPGWVPLKVFSESRDFTVRDRMLRTANR